MVSFCGAAGAALRQKTRFSLYFAVGEPRSDVVDVDDARERFDSGAGPRVNLEAAGDGDFDLARRQVENHCDPAATACPASDHTLEARERAGLAEKHPEPGCGISNDRVERFDLLRDQAQALLPAAHINRDDQRLTRIEQSPRLAQHLGKQGHLKNPTRIGHLDKSETAAARRVALLLTDDDAGELETSRGVRGSWRRGRADGSTGKSRSPQTRVVAPPRAANRPPAARPGAAESSDRACRTGSPGGSRAPQLPSSRGVRAARPR